MQACQVLRQPRATQRHLPKNRDDEKPLTRRIIELASIFGRYGYRRITALLRLDSWWVNHKRGEQIWRREGLKVPKKPPGRGRLWVNDGSCIRLQAERPDHVWTYDFVQAPTHEGCNLRMLMLVDKYTRECLSIDVARQLNREDVLERLAWLLVTRGVPDTSVATTARSSPRKPCENGCNVSASRPCSRSRDDLGRTVAWKASMANWQTSYWIERCSTRGTRRSC